MLFTFANIVQFCPINHNTYQIRSFLGALWSYLYSMMHLLKLICSPVSNIFNSALYTFHYVSIKTHLRFQLLHNNCNLHSTMYLLKQKGWILKQYRIYYLHSTMYLLKLKTYLKYARLLIHLHSTMYLLKQYGQYRLSVCIFIYIPPCIY